MVYKYTERIMLRCLPDDKKKLQQTAKTLNISCQEVIRQGIRLTYHITEDLEGEDK